jgi:hypothetical protein
MVDAQAEQARDRLGAEAGGCGEPGGLGAGVEGSRSVREPERPDETRVELRDRDLGGGIGDRARRALGQASRRARPG